MNPAIKYAFAALLLLGSTFSNADTGTYYQIPSGNLGAGRVYTSVNTNLCKSLNSEFYDDTYWKYANIYDETTNNPKCRHNTGSSGWTQFTQFQLKDQQCPSELPYANESGQCTDEQPQAQCESGSHTMFVRYTFSEMNAEGFNTAQAIIQNGGCLYDSTGVEECGVYPDGTKACLFEYTQTSTEAQGTEAQPEEYTEGQSPEGNSSNDTGATTYTTDPTVTNPDGSTTQTTNETTTNVSGSGTQIWNDDQFIYVRDSTGTTTIYDRQKTQTTNTDGSVDETVVTTRSTQTPSTTTTTVNKNSGNVTTTNNNQSSTSSTTNITNNYYDSEGNLTGSDSTTTNGNDVEGDPNEEGNCGAPGQPSCEVRLSGDGDLQDPAVTLDSATAQGLSLFDSSLVDISEIQNDEGSFFDFPDFNFFSGNSCDPTAFSSDYHGASFFPFQGFCSFYDNQMRPILYWALYMLTLFGLWRTYENAVTGGQK